MKILLHCEHTLRELNGRIWLALNLINRGHTVVLSEWPTDIDNLDLIRPDAIFINGADISRLKIIRDFYENGGHVFVLHTEGAIYTNELLHIPRFNDEVFPVISRMFEWGKVQKELVKKHTNIAPQKVINSGAPRFDLLRDDLREFYRSGADDYKDKYGEYILINTNFTHANPAKQKYKNSEISSERVQDFNEYLHSIEKLSYEYNNNIIVRPHPIEDINTYVDIFNDIENIHPIQCGDVRPWILGANAVIHAASTSGVESVMIGKNTYSYLPNGSRKHHPTLPIKVSEEVDNYDELAKNINNIDSSQNAIKDDGGRDILYEYFSNFTGKTAAETISDEIDKFKKPHNLDFATGNVDIKKRIKRICWRHAGTGFVDKIGKIHPSFDQEYYRTRVPIVTQNEVSNKIYSLKEIAGYSELKISIKNHSTLPNTYIIRESSNE